MFPLFSGTIRITPLVAYVHNFLLCIFPFLILLLTQIEGFEFAGTNLLHMTITPAFIILSATVGLGTLSLYFDCSRLDLVD